jgi:type III restriction enzyme
MVKYWVRNVVHPEYSFKLPTATGYFYPDFVAQLKDGRILVVEYKGSHLAEGSDTQEKQNIGELWEERSKGQGLFLMAVKSDESGRDVYQQLEHKIVGE